MKEGFRIGFDRKYTGKRATGNMILAISNPQPVSDFRQTETQTGRVVGRLPDNPLVHSNRFGGDPKAGSSRQVETHPRLVKPSESECKRWHPIGSMFNTVRIGGQCGRKNPATRKKLTVSKD